MEHTAFITLPTKPMPAVNVPDKLDANYRDLTPSPSSSENWAMSVSGLRHRAKWDVAALDPTAT